MERKEGFRCVDSGTKGVSVCAAGRADKGTRWMVLAGYNDLATTNPALVEEWDYERNNEKLPEHFTGGSKKKSGGDAIKAIAGFRLSITVHLEMAVPIAAAGML